MRDWYFFIKQTRFAIVISIIILLLGCIAIKNLPQEIYPDTSSPMVQVTTEYKGASASIIETTVANIIESSMTGLENLEYMKSTCYDGFYNLVLYFKAGSNKEVNLLNVKNQIQERNFQLPQDVQKNGVDAITTAGDKGSLILNLSAKSDNWEQLALSNYAKSNIIDKLKMADGVADAVIMGIGDYTMRIWLDPQKMSALKISVDDIKYALSEQNAQLVVGTLGAPPLKEPRFVQMMIKADNLLTTKEDFENIIIRSIGNQGQVLLGDIASVELGSSDYKNYAMIKDKNTALIKIIPSAGANIVKLSSDVKKKQKEISKWLPKDLSLDVIYDSSIYMRESINEVVETILVTVVIVVLVILLFLGDFTATLIPSIAIPVSLIGAFVVMYFCHLTINLLTLFALILAVSIVVDDAIVVVENVNRHLAEGFSPKRATQMTMEEVGPTLITMSLILTVVFLPICFIPGFTGILYRQFSIYLTASILISAVCALTLSPAMLSTMMLKINMSSFFQKQYDKFNELFQKIQIKYIECVKVFVNSPKITIFTYLSILLIVLISFKILPTSFLPTEDLGTINISISIKQDATLDKNKEVVKTIINNIKNLEGIDFNKLLVMGSDSNSTIIVQLKDWQKRKLNLLDKGIRYIQKKPTDLSNVGIQNEIIKKTRDINNAYIQVSSPTSFGGKDTGFEFNLIASDRFSFDDLSKVADKIVANLKENKNFAYIANSYYGGYPMYSMSIDYKKAMSMGISTSNLASTLATYIGSSEVGSFSKNGKNYSVIMQANDEFRRDRQDLNKISILNNQGELVSVNSIINLEEISSPPTIPRFNQSHSICIIGQKSPQVSSGQAMRVLMKEADKVLPKEITYEWSGAALQELESSGQTYIIIGISLFFIYLFLVALYNSWLIPIVILIIAPVSMFGALLLQLMLGQPFDLYSQIGIITLIGLSAKQSILYIEYAIELHDKEGFSILMSALTAANLRFRAILMTELSFLFGVIPMLFAVGPSANSRISIAITVFGGMLTTVTVGTILTPAFYVIVQNFIDKFPKPADEKYISNTDLLNNELLLNDLEELIKTRRES